MKKVLLLALFLVGCTNEELTYTTLRKAGFTDIRTTGYEWMACGEEDQYSTGFVAKNPGGASVSGVVCCGYWKRCTVRF